MRADIGQQCPQAAVTDLDVGTIAFREDGFAGGELDRSNLGRPASREQPGFALDFDRPDRVGKKFDLLEDKMRVDHDGLPRFIELHRRRLAWGSAGDSCSNGTVDMQLPLPAIVKEPKGHVAALLNLRKNDAGADRVNGAGRHKDNVTRACGMPLHHIDDRTVRDG
jgi:hypothetical protein